MEEIRLDDGSVDEWYELVGEPAMTLLDFTKDYEDGSPLDPTDLDFRIWLAWHDDPVRFYAAFVASDDVYKNTYDITKDIRADIMLVHDSIMLAIDGDHSGGVGGSSSTQLEEWVELGGQTNYYEAIARTVGGPTLDNPGTRIQTGEFAWTALPPYGEGGGGVAGEAPIISVIELYVTPFDHWAGWDSPGGDRAQQSGRRPGPWICDWGERL